MTREQRQPRIAVLGAGAGGIATGVALKRAGFDFTIYEKSDGVGGTWRDNTYPGAACDVPSHLYSFSFAPNPWWSQTFATQPEILTYLEACTDRFGLRPHLRLSTAITAARWSEGEQLWVLTTEAGETVEAEILISALGMLNVPQIPEFPGQEQFRGRIFHSSRWDHSKPLAGERVASIGTGASAIQYVPAIAEEVEHLTVFQRSPVWVAPRFEVTFTPEQQRRFAKVPFAARRERWRVWWAFQRSTFAADSEQISNATGLAYSYLQRKVEDEELRARLTPDFPAGCKRPLTSRRWFPALCRPNVEVVTEPISELTAAGIRTADGREHPVDSIILGTGFRANEYLTTVDITGRDGMRLQDAWADGAEAHLGVTTAGFPNLFMLYGPNTNGVTSILFMHEAQASYITKVLRMMRRRRLASVEVRRGVQDRYNAKLQAAMAGTVWLAGCNNYYSAPGGKVVTQLPYSPGEYWLRTRLIGSWRFIKTRRRG